MIHLGSSIMSHTVSLEPAMVPKDTLKTPERPGTPGKLYLPFFHLDTVSSIFLPTRREVR